MDKINLDELIKGNTEVVEDNPVEEIEEPTNEVVEEPVSEEVEEPVKEEPVSEEPIKEEEPTNDFPSDKFDGKYNSWDEVIEALNKEPEVKEPEYKDDFIKKVVDKYNKDGDLESFFKAYSTNWKDMPHEQVLKAKFKEENSQFDDKTFEYAWKKQLAKYGDPDLLTKPDEELEDDELAEKRYATAMIQKKADQVRKEKLEEQESYLQPKVEKKEEPPLKVEDAKKIINDIPEVQNILKNKKLTYKIGDADFNLDVTDTSKIINTLADENILINGFLKDGKNGKEIDVQAWADMVNWRYNGEKVRQALVDHGKSLARKEIIDDEYKNTTMKKNPARPQEDTDKAVGLAKAFTQAFAKTK